MALTLNSILAKYSVADASLNCESLDDQDLLNCAWAIGYLYHSLELEERGELLERILIASLTREKNVRYWVFAPFRDSVFGMSESEARRYFDCFFKYADLSGGPESESIRIDLNRFRALITDQSILQRITEYQSSSGERTIESQQALPPSVANEAPYVVVLVVPPFLSGRSFLQPPLGFLITAAKLRQVGFTPVLFDLRTEENQAQALVRAIETAQLICVCTTPYDQVQNYFVDFRYWSPIRTIEFIKGVSKSPIVVCGSHGTVRPDLVFRDTLADYCIRGEYEDAIVELSQFVTRGLNNKPKHVLTRDEPTEAFTGDLGLFPVDIARSETLETIPAYDLLNFDHYFGDGYENNKPVRRRNWATILANRGCPYTCTYCFNFWGRKFRKREVHSVIDELELLQNVYAVRHVFVLDFTFTADKKWVHEFCLEYRRRQLKIRWTCETRVDCVDQELLEEMHSAGGEGIWFGVENFVPGIIEDTTKYPTSYNSMTVVNLARRAGLDPHVFIMIGLPGETKKTLLENMHLIRQANAPYTQSVIVSTPRYGTPYYIDAEEQYSELNLRDSFFKLNAVRGLVKNDLRPSDIKQAIVTMQNRGLIFSSARLTIT